MVLFIKKICFYLALPVLMLCGVPAAAQVKKDARQELTQVLNTLKLTKRMAFKQLMVMNYENGTRDSLLTDMALDMDAKSLYSRNPHCEITLNRQYYTRTDHLDKTVSVFDMKLYSSQLNFDMDTDELFNHDLMIQALDTLLNVRLNTVESKTADNITTFNISFPAGYYIKTIELQFHTLLNMPVKYVINAQFGSYTEAYGGVSSYQVILYDYTRNVDDRVFLPADFIKISNKKVELTHYKNYQLTTLL